MSVTGQQARQILARADCLYTAADVDRAYDRLAEAISAKLEGSDPLVLCVMTGALIPAGQLLTRINFPLQIDYIHATRYRGDTRGGQLDWKVAPTTSLQDRVVLIIDDILDEGITLARILDYCREQGAREVYGAVLVNKLHERKALETVDFVGLTVEDRYVFGCGMDYKGYLRNIPGIYAVNEA